jgi:Flp pilus assembly protein TadB
MVPLTTILGLHTEVLLGRWGALALLGALAAYLIASGGPLWRPRPTLEERVRALETITVESAAREQDARARASALMRFLGPLLEDLGRVVERLAGRFGLGTNATLAQDLALVRPGRTLASFYGDQCFAALLALAGGPILNALGVTPFGRWPLGPGLLLAAAALAAPVIDLQGKLAARRDQFLQELVPILDHLSIALSAGASTEEALKDVAEHGRSVVADELRAALAEAASGRAGLRGALLASTGRNNLPAYTAVVRLVTGAEKSGLQLSESLAAQAAALRDRQQAELLAAGGKTMIKMLLPVAVCMLPVLLLILFVPAGAQLFRLGAQ